MTLCALWLEGEHFSLASDSRLTIGSATVDVAMKVAPLPVVFHEPPTPDSGPPLLTRQHVLGVAFSGSLAIAQALRESLQVALTRLQSQPGYTDQSLEAVCTIIGEFFESLARSVCAVLAQGGSTNFFLAGLDPVSKRPGAFLFDLDTSGFPIRASWGELTTSEMPAYIGNGRSAALHYAASHPEAPPYQVIKAVILDANVPSVGGPIQYARIGPDGYVPFGLYDYQVDHAAKLFYQGYFIGGVEVDYRRYRPRFPHIMLSYLNPFTVDIAALKHSGYSPADAPL